MDRKIWVQKAVRQAFCFAVLAVGFVLVAGQLSAGPVFNPDGTITNGNKSVSLDNTGRLILKTGDKTLRFVVCFFKINPVTKTQDFFAAYSLADRKLAVIPENKEIRFSGTYTDPDSQKSMEFRMSATLDKDGLVAVQHKCSTNELFDLKILAQKEGWLYLDMPYAVFAGHSLKLDDRLIVLDEKQIRDGEKVIPIEPKENSERVLRVSAAPEKLVLFADLPDTALTILTMKKESVQVVSDVSGKKQNLMIGLPSTVRIDLGR